MDIFKLIDEAEVISFDIFDTLIRRRIAIPSDVFEYVQYNFFLKTGKSLTRFKRFRIISERIARRRTKKFEITLDEIYEQLKRYYSKEDLELLKRIEEQSEIELSACNVNVLDYYNYAIRMNKKVIIVTDMYLSKDIIEAILYKNGIVNYENIFISSELNMTKYNGNIYKHIFRKLEVSPSKMLHIGDNLISDYKNPIKLGINAYVINNDNSVCKYNNYINRRDYESRCAINIIDTFLKRNTEKYNNKGESFNLGYNTLGPLLYGFLQWINMRAMELKLDKIIFLSRDGYIVQEAYDNFLKGVRKIDTSYMYASRRALIVPSIDENTEFDELIKLLGLRKKDTINTFFKRIGLNSNEYIGNIKNCGLHIDENINSSNLNRVHKLFNSIKRDVVNNSLKEKEIFLKYIKQINVESKKVGIVDIGWRGSMQYSLEKILKNEQIDVDLKGFYLGLNRDSLKFINKGINAEGYLFSAYNNVDLEFRSSSYIGLLESMFLAPHGSVIGYKVDESKNVIPILDEYEYKKEDLTIISDIQKGALEFIKDFSIDNSKIGLIVNEHAAMHNINKVGSFPNKEQVETLGNISFSDFDSSHLAKPQSLKRYILNPKKFKNDFFKSQWKVGFLKGVFKIKLPYFYMYSLMKSVYERREK